MRKPFYANLSPMHSGVTGSCFHLKAVFPDGKTHSILIDTGMFQEKDFAVFNELPMPRCARTAECLLVTHNHIDHIGRVPELVRDGFKGPIYCSQPTSRLLDKAWFDCLKIEETTAARMKRHPRFKSKHVTEAIRHIKPCGYGERIQIQQNIYATFLKNGHVYGSALILIEIESPCTNDPPINFLFSGDYNDENFFFDVEDLPNEVKEMPLHIVSESTYGANDKGNAKEKVFVRNILRQLELGKNILIPTFAYERGQVILTLLAKLQEEGKLDSNIPIYIDGKLLKEYTQFYVQEARKDFRNPEVQILPDNHRWVAKNQQRDEIANDGMRKIIVTTAGMGSFGPAQIYIPTFVSNEEAVIHFTGYQCEGTVGRKLIDASESGDLADIHGRLLDVKAMVFHTGEFSSHASQAKLLDFLGKFKNVKSISLNHGDKQSKQDLARKIIAAKMVKEVPVLTRGSMYRYDSYKLVKVVDVELYN